MDSRRDFLRKAALLSGGTAMVGSLPPVIQKALAINPAPGSNFYDAEHIVFLMQENRSFDHAFGTLQGVRGFNDPRAVRLPDNNKVFLQSTKDGDTYAPFRLDINGTKAAWMGALPHGWSDQTDARNDGKFDKWLDVKKVRNKAYADMPLTLGYCTRADFPFYYSLADAFTVCDQHFCSSITGTHPNRHYWMTGTVRERMEAAAKAHLWNVKSFETPDPELNWKTFPERLQEQGVSWKIYQNEIIMGYGSQGEESAWLSNFGTNVMEYFGQYNVRLSQVSLDNVRARKAKALQAIEDLQKLVPGPEVNEKLTAARKELAKMESDEKKYTKEMFDALTQAQKELNEKAFVTNKKDPDYHNLTPLKYNDNGTERELNIPKGDVFHQFREDVQNGTLPTVSWLMPPDNFSDHPSNPWYGPLYVSEIMEILIQNPEVWKKTIFVLTYDENDGYFDHVPPFVVPNPYKEHSGKVSAGIDPKLDFVTKDQQDGPVTSSRIRENSIGLGYRVPMVIASPWTRGGFVCSEVFDHTSSLQFLENFLQKKFNKKIKEENITEWRRTICGDLTSAFRPYNGEKIEPPVFLEREAFMESIHQAKFKQLPNNYKKLTPEEVALINSDSQQSPYFPKQEKGVRSANPLPYELYVDGAFNKDKNAFEIKFKAGNTVFGSRAAGSPFYVYAAKPYLQEAARTWNYSAAAGDTLEDTWPANNFDKGNYHLRVYGPNGFYREFAGSNDNAGLQITCTYETGRLNKSSLTGNVIVTIINNDTKAHSLQVIDNSYKIRR